MPRPPISALVHTLNEADQIVECLSSITWADEILLLDSYSTDGTIDVVRQHFPHVRIEQRKSLGSAAQKNYGMDQVSNDWVLVVDADERITPELRDEILGILESGPTCAGYSIGRRNIILGEEVFYSGLQRDRVTRLFDRRHARYPNKRVHADLEVNGQVGRLRSRMLHYYVRSLDHAMEKMTRYGVWGSAQMFIDGRRASTFDIASHAAGRFLRDYVLGGGFLDGARGLVMCGLHSYYVFWKYVKLWEMTQLERRGAPVPLPEMERSESIWARPWENETGPGTRTQRVER